MFYAHPWKDHTRSSCGPSTIETSLICIPLQLLCHPSTTWQVWALLRFSLAGPCKSNVGSFQPSLYHAWMTNCNMLMMPPNKLIWYARNVSPLYPTWKWAALFSVIKRRRGNYVQPTVHGHTEWLLRRAPWSPLPTTCNHHELFTLQDPTQRHRGSVLPDCLE